MGLKVEILRIALWAISRGFRVVVGAPPQETIQYDRIDWHKERHTIRIMEELATYRSVLKMYINFRTLPVRRFMCDLKLRCLSMITPRYFIFSVEEIAGHWQLLCSMQEWALIIMQFFWLGVNSKWEWDKLCFWYIKSEGVWTKPAKH